MCDADDISLREDEPKTDPPPTFFLTLKFAFICSVLQTRTLYSNEITCPACEKANDPTKFERYMIPAMGEKDRAMGFTKPDLIVLVCPRCGNLFTKK